MNLIYGMSDVIIEFVLAMILGLAVRQSFRLLRQSWATTSSSLILFCLLPATTYAVTTVIAGDIALSLGMVGALSIVRFRNPVRSPAELTAYFVLISIGICLTQNKLVAIALTSVVILLAAFLLLASQYNLVAKLGMIGNNDFVPPIYIVTERASAIDDVVYEKFSSNLRFEQISGTQTREYQYRWEFKRAIDADDLMAVLRSDPNTKRLDKSLLSEVETR